MLRLPLPLTDPLGTTPWWPDYCSLPDPSAGFLLALRAAAAGPLHDCVCAIGGYLALSRIEELHSEDLAQLDLARARLEEHLGPLLAGGVLSSREARVLRRGGDDSDALLCSMLPRQSSMKSRLPSQAEVAGFARERGAALIRGLAAVREAIGDASRTSSPRERIATAWADLDAESAVLWRGNYLSDDEVRVLGGPDLMAASEIVQRFTVAWCLARPYADARPASRSTLTRLLRRGSGAGRTVAPRRPAAARMAGRGRHWRM